MATSTRIDSAAADAYERDMVPGMFRHWTEMLVEIAAPRAGEHVLDVACGTGIGARLAADAAGEAGRVAGLDIDAGVIEYARQLTRDATHAMEWHCASALEMPFESATFDLCLCLQGLQFFPDRVKGLTEIRRVLKPGGRLVASIWGPLEHNKGHEAVVQALERGGVDASAAKRACSFTDPDAIRDAAAKAGFTRTDLRSVDGRARFASVDSFLNGMTKGSPSTRHAVALLADDARGRFFDDVRAALVPYMDSGLLAYPMRTHILVAHAAPN